MTATFVLLILEPTLCYPSKRSTMAGPHCATLSPFTDGPRMFSPQIHRDNLERGRGRGHKRKIARRGQPFGKSLHGALESGRRVHD